MKIILEEKNRYILRFDKKEEVISELLKFCALKKINAGFFSGLGAIQETDLAWYDVDEKTYKEKTFNEKMEILNFIGNIAVMKGKTVIHCHGTFGSKDMETFGGHVKKIVVAATCEILLESFDGKIEREYSNEIGLNLLK